MNTDFELTEEDIEKLAKLKIPPQVKRVIAQSHPYSDMVPDRRGRNLYPSNFPMSKS